MVGSAVVTTRMRRSPGRLFYGKINAGYRYKVLTVARCVQYRGLEYHKWRGDGVLDLDFDGIRQVLRNSRHCQQVCRSDKEVAVERRHP